MFAGEHVNNTEDRAALHVALRRPSEQSLELDGEDVMPLVCAERHKMRALSDALHAGELKGFSGDPIRHVVNIGIGGSDLGLVMGVDALAEYVKPGLSVHFVSNVDGVQLAQALDRVDPAATLFVICSKSFTTLETLTNAQGVREFLLSHGGEAAVAAQCVAVSTNHEAMDAFGIAGGSASCDVGFGSEGATRCGRRSALSLALAPRLAAFRCAARRRTRDGRALPRGAAARESSVLLALIGVWNRNFLDMPSHAVLPYDYHLHRFPAYLQQLEMESNGKSVRRNGEPVECATCPVVWGEPGNNAQHAFYQLLHQGTEHASLDFVVPARSGVGRQAQHDLAIANCLAQTLALAVGREADDPHRSYTGNRPSSLIAFERLDPATLGKLVALYEHKVYVQGVIWDINSFDQWGVELGKALATELTATVGDTDRAGPAAIELALSRLRAWRA